jgi:hypothetical protein
MCLTPCSNCRNNNFDLSLKMTCQRIFTRRVPLAKQELLFIFSSYKMYMSSHVFWRCVVLWSSIRLYSHLFCMGFKFYLYLFTYSGVQHHAHISWWHHEVEPTKVHLVGGQRTSYIRVIFFYRKLYNGGNFSTIWQNNTHFYTILTTNMSDKRQTKVPYGLVWYYLHR